MPFPVGEIETINVYKDGTVTATNSAGDTIELGKIADKNVQSAVTAFAGSIGQVVDGFKSVQGYTPQICQAPDQIADMASRGGTVFAQIATSEIVQKPRGNAERGAVLTLADAVSAGTVVWMTEKFFGFDPAQNQADLDAYNSQVGYLSYLSYLNPRQIVTRVKSGISSVKEMIRIRHYTSNSGIKGIAESGVIKASDQNKVFADLAKGKPLSPRDAEEKFGIKRGKGQNYVETDVPADKIDRVYNPKTKVWELTVKGDVILENPTFEKR